MRSARGNYHRLLPARIGVNARGKSRRLQRALADFGVEESFAKAAARVHEHYGITLGTTAVREATLLHARRARIRLESEYEKPFRALPVHGAARVVAQADGSMVCTVPAGRRKSPRPSPSSAVKKVASLMESYLCDFSGDFLHYILHEFGTFGQVQAEVSQQ